MQKKTIIIIVVAVVAAFFFIAVAIFGIRFFLAYKVNKEAGITDMHTLVDKQGSGGKIELKDGQIEVGKAAQWPADIPSDVPEFTYGKVKVVTKSEMKNKKGWNVLLENVSADALENTNRI
ncbi:MAG: hypothetical protein N3A72_09075 [bacterium]|nr:hypothetical protein [bacterium]